MKVRQRGTADHAQVVIQRQDNFPACANILQGLQGASCGRQPWDRRLEPQMRLQSILGVLDQRADLHIDAAKGNVQRVHAFRNNSHLRPKR